MQIGAVHFFSGTSFASTSGTCFFSLQIARGTCICPQSLEQTQEPVWAKAFFFFWDYFGVSQSEKKKKGQGSGTTASATYCTSGRCPSCETEFIVQMLTNDLTGGPGGSIECYRLKRRGFKGRAGYGTGVGLVAAAACSENSPFTCTAHGASGSWGRSGKTTPL